MSEHPDRSIPRADLEASLPEELRPFVALLPGCEDCDDIAIDTSIAVLLRLITAMVAPEPVNWRRGVVASIGRVLDHELLTEARPS